VAATITKAGESLIAQKLAAGEVLNVVRFVLALVPDLDPNAPVDRDGLKPPAGQVVHTQEYTQKGFVNPNEVVYSLMMGSDQGDFDWNWIGLETEENVLLSVAYVPVQQKRRNMPPQQIGNNVTRNFLVMFDGAKALTAITIDANTWQHDFTVRLAGIDERERQSNRSLYGRRRFFSDGLRFEKNGSGYQLHPGIAYIEGVRVELIEPLAVPGVIPVGMVWIDVSLQRHGNDRVATWKVGFGDWADYTDGAGVDHYCVVLAEFKSSSNIVDLRLIEPFPEALVDYWAARDGDYEHLRARATTKEDVDLGNVPNAISDDPATNSSAIIASTAALNRLQQSVADSMTGMVATFDMPNAPPGWIKCNGAAISRTSYARLFSIIGTRYGAGDGVNTFNVKDMRGKFIRGLSDGSSVDAWRALGSEQGSQNLTHVHAASSSADGYHGHGGGIDVGGWHGHGASTGGAGAFAPQVLMGGNGIAVGGNTAGSVMGSSSGGAYWREFGSGSGDHAHVVNIAGDGNHTHGLRIDANGAHAHTIYIGAEGGNEARPLNVAFLVCIKY
jgi:hypothetical protein